MIATTETVVIVRIDLAAASNVPDVLDEEERSRADRITFERDRRRFIVSHSALRLILGRQLGMRPELVRFETGARGKPRLADAPGDVRFNMSHSGELAVFAIALGREVGIDIEEHRSIDVVALAEYALSSNECAQLKRLPQEERREAFYRCWTRKESFIKARGDGVWFPLDGFDVSLELGAEQLLLACPASPADMCRWIVVDLPTHVGYSAALTIEAVSGRTPTRPTCVSAVTGARVPK